MEGLNGALSIFLAKAVGKFKNRSGKIGFGEKINGGAGYWFRLALVDQFFDFVFEIPEVGTDVLGEVVGFAEVDLAALGLHFFQMFLSWLMPSTGFSL